MSAPSEDSKTGSPVILPTMTRSIPSLIAGTTAIAFSLATFILTVVLAVFQTIVRRRLYILALAATITQILLLCTLSYLVVRYTRRAPRHGLLHGHEWRERRNLFILVLGIIPSTIAGLVVGATLGWSKTDESEEPRYVLGLKSASFMLMLILFWLCAVLTQIVFYFFLVFAGVATRPPDALHRTEESQALQAMVEPSRPETSATAQSSPLHENQFHELAIPTSSAPSVAESEGTSSLRSSLSMVQRPNNSKTRLIRQHSHRQTNQSADSPSAERASQDSGFDSWDTSAVAPHIRETVLLSSPGTRGKPLKPLEPIPGSRSPSPATALEGPFFPQPESSSPPQSPLPQPSVSGPEFRQRAPSSEDHIHPLFRTCSPTPPPTASSGTTLTAAPVAGQLVHGRFLRRMRSGSLPSSMSPLIRSSFDQFIPRPSTDTSSQDALIYDLMLPGAYPTSPVESNTPH